MKGGLFTDPLDAGDVVRAVPHQGLDVPELVWGKAEFLPDFRRGVVDIFLGFDQVDRDAFVN